MPKITIAGVEHDVTDAVAASINTAAAETAKVLADAKSAIESGAAAKSAAEAKAKEEADAKVRSEVTAAAKAGDFDRALKLSEDRVRGIADSYAADKLAEVVRAHPKLRKTGLDDAARTALINDVVAGLRPAASFDLERRALTIAVDGKPVDPTAHLDAFLTARPHLCEPTVPAGSGAHGSGQRQVATGESLSPTQSISAGLAAL